MMGNTEAEMSTKGAYPFADKKKQYRRYTDAELEFAIDDAIHARDAMAGFDPIAENWYADDVFTISDEISRRAAGGGR